MEASFFVWITATLKRSIDCTHRVRDFSCCISIVVTSRGEFCCLAFPHLWFHDVKHGFARNYQMPQKLQSYHTGKNVDELSNVWIPHFFNIRVPSLIYLHTNDGLSSAKIKKMVNLYITMKNHRVGKSTISMAMFNGKLLVYQVVYTYW